MPKRGRAEFVFVVAAWSVSLQACYESLPIQQGAAPDVGRVELVLNDQGRAALAERMGPMIQKIEGPLVSQQADAYTISVATVSYLNVTAAHWNGEQVTIRKDHTMGFQVRQLSKVRTFGLATALTVGAILLFFGKSLIGGGSDEKGTGEPTPVVR